MSKVILNWNGMTGNDEL